MNHPSSHVAHNLLSTELFILRQDLPPQERAALSYERAKRMAATFALTRLDTEELTPKYWRMHTDPLLLCDGAATTLLTIQLNLVAGTIATYVHDRPDLSPLLEQLIRFEVSGQFLLTEVDHGLDAINLETTATLLPCGGFSLCTPHPGAAKCMPPTIPCGPPTVSVVFAKMIANGHNKGVFPFIVRLNDGARMCPGITARLLPYRGGSNPVNHSLTSFSNVYLPPSALLRHASGNEDCESSATRRLEFLASIWRVAVGSLSLAALAIPNLQISALIAARYSQRRTVATPGGRVPLITFTTSHAPDLDPRVRHGVATAMKVVAVQHAQEGNLELSERCGNQGLFGHNQMATLYAEQRGIAIAEGDLLGLSIRLCSELLLERYELPTSTHPSSPLAQHENSLLASNRAIILSMVHHRASDFNDRILPHCQSVIEAIGLRMAYDAAVDAGLDAQIIDVYLASAIRRDPVWYSEQLNLTNEQQFEMQRKALYAALPKLNMWLKAVNVDEYISAPIVSAEKWGEFVDGLEAFDGGRIEPRDASGLKGVLMDVPILAHL
ncbi:hypothetical protein BDZ94DRAFT_1292410 [Collybia nuda]|uniref:Acyl-CoA dehydrogenase NM domain-like protein n=1 Tax=Collybia nuda TaxID=64659 RepID=A0A9P5XVP2_9AGAR|nr:hypothetical protein BDZ94DRAFT_1292410 [Collybia nuda]